MKNISPNEPLREVTYTEALKSPQSTWTARAAAALAKASYDVISTSVSTLLSIGDSIHHAGSETLRLSKILEALQRDHNSGISEHSLHRQIDQALQESRNIAKRCAKDAALAAQKLQSAKSMPASVAEGHEAALKSMQLEIGRSQSHANREARLGRSIAKAEAENQLKTMFIANMSHEIRSPVAVIKGFAELLAREGVGSHKKQQWIDSVLHASQQLEMLINDMLDISKIEAGKLNIVLSDVSLRLLMNEIITVMDARAKAKGLHFRVLIDHLIPSMIRTDEVRLNQILHNIIGNAIKFTPKGSVEVTLKWDGTQNNLSFAVRDEGIGISPDHQHLLFEAFSQAEKSIGQRFGGTGLGLALSRHLAQLLGGDIHFHSIEGQGSTFTILVKTGLVNTSELIADLHGNDRTPVARQDHAMNLRGLVVLLVEDAPDIAAMMKQILKTQGVDVKLATNGREGLQCARAKDFDLILMDIQMPVMNGYEAARQLRLEGFRLPIFALTGRAMQNERELCKAAGFTDCLTKPFSITHLLETIKNSQPTALH